MNKETSFANAAVLEFYKELPFNIQESAEDQANTVRSQNSVTAYPVLVDLLKRDTRVIEVGCGAGWLANSIAYHYGSRVTAIDFNPVAVERAQAVASTLELPVEFRVEDLFQYYPDEPADIAVSIGVLHHTDNCHAAVRHVMNNYAKPGGHVFIGLYHLYGRRPFLQHFEEMQARGADEDEMFARYCELMPQATDATHARSWFRDQVLHPHETQHTMAEMLDIIDECGADLLSTSINRFEPIDDIEDVLAEETAYEDMSRKWLSEGRYFPGFFVFLVRKRD